MKPLPKVAWILGYAGLIPFAVLSFAILMGKTFTISSNLPLAWWQATYAAIILSFLGAVSWGVALGMQEQLDKSDINKLISYSVIPSVLAWLALLLPVKIALFVLAGLVVFAYIVDAMLLFPKINSEYSGLRMQLSTAVVVLLCFSAIVTV
jgi:hypothetical protein